MIEEQRAQVATIQADTQRSLKKQQRTTWIMLGVLLLIFFAWPVATWILSWVIGSLAR